MEYRTITEAADMLRVSRTTVWRWIRDGSLPAYRAGPRTIRIREADLENRVRRRRGAPELTKAGEEEIWANYDPVKALAALRKAKGIFKGLDTEQLKKDLKEARSQHSRRGRPSHWPT